MGLLGNFKDSFREVLWITKNVLTTFWFWLPILYMLYVLLQFWMVFYIHPLTLLILPVILVVYGILLEDKRIRAKYGLTKTKRLSASYVLGENPEPMRKTEWEVERTVEQYRRLLKDDKTGKKKK